LKTTEDILTVSQLSRRIRRLIEDGLPFLWIEGEISNFKRHSSGHRYFTLKDSEAQIACVMWRTRRAPGIELTDGLSVRVYGKVTVWEQGGRYQFDVQSVLPVGLGDLQAAFEALKRKLAAEGLFDQARKKQLPRFPAAIGIVTSLTGAAIRDIVWGFNKRYPPADLYLIPVAVQGEGSAEQIAAAIESFNRLNFVDVIVIGRGGGSLEDLWAFNEEPVVRAVADSRLPIVSAVGHEVDVTLSDLAADLRAPTPTAASGLVVPDRDELKKNLNEWSGAFTRMLKRTISLWRERVQALIRGYGFRRVEGRIGEERMRLDELTRRMEFGLTRRFDDYTKQLESFRLQLSALSPDAVLKRGFCVAKRQDGVIVRRSDQVKVGEELNLKFSKGGSAAYVLEVWSHAK